MMMNKEEQLNRYFEHTMSSKEEQNFLISVAASDEMRIAFRSHLELIKAVRDDKDALRSVAQVRNRTLTALGLSATAVTPFIERELVRRNGGAAASAPVAADLGGAGISTVSAPWISRVLGVFRSPLLTLTAGLALGVASTAVVMHTESVQPVKNGPIMNSATPTTQQATHRKGVAHETIQTAKSLDNSGRPVELANRVSHSRQHVQDARNVAGSAMPTPSEVTKHGAPQVDDANSTVSSKIPETSVGVAGTVQSAKATITRDSSQAK